MSTATHPSIGRKLWLFLDFELPRRQHLKNLICLEPGRPFDASIAFIHPKTEGSPFDYVTVSVADHLGTMHALMVPLRQEGQPRPDAREWAEWPKYQREQAKAPEPLAASASDLADEELIVAKGKTAPRVTPAAIASIIVGEHYFTAAEGVSGAAWVRVLDEQAGTINAFDAAPPPAPLGLLTFCVLVLCNGFTVTGESACASPENFDAEIGRKIARDNAIAKVWPLEGYLLKQRLFEATKS